MPHLTYKTRLVFDNQSCSDNLYQMLVAQRFAWNECSKVKFNKVEKNSIVDLHEAFYRKFRDCQSIIPAQLVISAEQSVLSCFRSIKSNKYKIDKAPEKKKLSVRLDKRTYSFKNGIFSLISLGSRVKAKPYIYDKLQEALSKYKFCDPELLVINNEIWIALTFDVPEKPATFTSCLGVDLGCRINAATSEGNLFVDKKFNGRKRKLRHLKDCLKSKGTKSAKKHLKKLRRKEANANKNFTHHLTNAIISSTKADVIAIEDLKGIKKKKGYENKNRISQIPFYQFRTFLTYKALLAEKTVIVVKSHYTSQIDFFTGKREGIRKGRRFYSLSGKIYDSDINGACNIARRSKHPVSLSPLGGCETYGQAIVNSPIVGR